MDRKKIIGICIAILISSSAFSQIGVSSNFSVLKAFSPYKAHYGLGIGLEIPRDDAMTLYGRFTHYFKNRYAEDSLTWQLEPRDLSAGLPYLFTSATPSMNYNVIEGGTRYYIGDGYDNGFGGYGGSSLMLVFNKVKYEIEPYDEVNYISSSANYREGSIFSLGFGLNGGVKYSKQPIGTFFADFGFTYIIFAQASIEPLYSNPFKALFFTFNFGYRKDILW